MSGPFASSKSARFAALLLVGSAGLALSDCHRLKRIDRPDGVPAGAVQEGKTGLWVHSTAERYTRYYSNGQRAQAGPLADGQREGLWQSWSMDGRTLISAGRYRNGRRDGEWRYYDNLGRLYLVMRYAPKPARNFGIFFHPDYGNENGPYERYFPDGRLEERGTFRGGFYEGAIVRYYRDGRLAVRGAYHRDQREGTWTHYYPEGGLERTETFRDGKLHGMLRNYHPDGKLYQAVRYEQGRRMETSEIHPLVFAPATSPSR